MNAHNHQIESRSGITHDAPRCSLSPLASTHADTNARMLSGSARHSGRSRPIRNRILAALALTLFVAGATAATAWWYHARGWVKTDNASVSGHIHAISPRIAGTVVEVFVRENEEVDAGTALIQLDPTDLRIQEEKARAGLAEAGAQWTHARAQVAREQALFDKAQLDFDRAEKLFHSNDRVISDAEFDASKASLDAARNALKAADAACTLAEARQNLALAQLHEISTQLTYTRIDAPVTGRIGRKNVETGNRVQPGQSLLAVVQSDVWVTANFKETQLERLRPGQAVQIRIDAFPGTTLRGRLDSVSPASGAQFALLPPDNATGNFTKVVQRVPVRITFDPESLRALRSRIVPGMSVTVRVDVKSTS